MHVMGVKLGHRVRASENRALGRLFGLNNKRKCLRNDQPLYSAQSAVRDVLGM